MLFGYYSVPLPQDAEYFLKKMQNLVYLTKIMPKLRQVFFQKVIFWYFSWKAGGAILSASSALKSVLARQNTIASDVPEVEIISLCAYMFS